MLSRMRPVKGEGVGHVVPCDADLVAQGVAHLLHGLVKARVVESCGRRGGARAAALKGPCCSTLRGAS